MLARMQANRTQTHTETHKKGLTESREELFSAAHKTSGLSANTLVELSVNRLVFFSLSLPQSAVPPPSISLESLKGVHITRLSVPPLGVPRSGHHSRYPHPVVCARTQERQRRPDGRTHQGPNLLVV